MQRILIEFYSRHTSENLISLLKERYQGVIFFYFARTNEPSPDTQKLLQEEIQTLFGFTPEFYAIPEKTLSCALEHFSHRLSPDHAFDFDITGGSEVFIAAAGMFVERNRERLLSLHQYDVKTGSLVFCYPERGNPPELFPIYLTAPQLLALNRTPCLRAPRYQFSFGPLRNEILKLWNAVKRFPKQWNDFCSMSADPFGGKSSVKQKYIGNKSNSSQTYHVISQRLKQAGILTDEVKKTIRGKVYMEFELNVVPEAQFLYEKAGTLLEMYAALAAFDADVFHDIRVGVSLDWNGEITAGHKPDPKNEIDLILMHENLPILASCKNTYPKNDYLYEIITMAKHYGTFFATPMLISSSAATPTVRQRAKEMGILLFDSVAGKSFQELVRSFRSAFAKKS